MIYWSSKRGYIEISDKTMKPVRYFKAERATLLSLLNGVCGDPFETLDNKDYYLVPEDKRFVGGELVYGIWISYRSNGHLYRSARNSKGYTALVKYLELASTYELQSASIKPRRSTKYIRGGCIIEWKFQSCIFELEIANHTLLSKEEKKRRMVIDPFVFISFKNVAKGYSVVPLSLPTDFLVNGLRRFIYESDLEEELQAFIAFQELGGLL